MKITLIGILIILIHIELKGTKAVEVSSPTKSNAGDSLPSIRFLTTEARPRRRTESGPHAITLVDPEHYLLSAMMTPPPHFPNNDLPPSFADTTETNVTVIRGKAAVLHCHVLNLGTKSVSWIRHEDLHVLTVGRVTFANDDRFEAHNTPGSGVWSLRIMYPQMTDSGKYECQVSSRPPVAKVVQLNVVEPQAIIPLEPELFIDKGSPLNITCVIYDSPEPPEHIFWYHRNKMVAFDGSTRDATVTNIKGDVTTSILKIAYVEPEDSGVYTCSPSAMKEASVTVRVLNGELPQAMQTASTCRASYNYFVFVLSYVFFQILRESLSL